MVLGIYGSGGSGRELRDIAQLVDLWEELVFIDDTVERGTFQGINRMAFEDFCQMYSTKHAEIIIAQGEPKYKIALYEKAEKKGYSFANLIHPLSFISSSARLGKGIVIQAGAIVSSDTVIENNVHILYNAVIGHDCFIHKNCQISPGVTVGGQCEIGQGSFIGMNSAIKEKVKIGENVAIGMNSAVFQNVPENVIAMGNPVRLLPHKDGSMAVFRQNNRRYNDIDCTETTNLDKYNSAFINVFRICRDQLGEAEYKVNPSWDSMGHMWLIEELEKIFGIAMAVEDVMNFESYKKGKEILKEHYGIKF